MRANRLFVSAAAIALVAGPGLAVAQNGPPDETPPVATPPVVDTPPEQTPPVDTPPVAVLEGGDEQRGTQVEEEVEDLDAEGFDAEQRDADDPAHGEAVSALAECLPSGAELHGTGLTKGYVMRQVASGDEVEIDVPDEGPTTFALPDELEILCAAVTAMAEAAEVPETAKGRPDWAGPKDRSQVATSPDDRRGPPAHAANGGTGKRANGS